MDTQIPTLVRRGRGRPITGVVPSNYDHARLLAAVNSRRRLEIKSMCFELGISRAQFYDIINGRVNPARDHIASISRYLDLDPEEILHEN